MKIKAQLLKCNSASELVLEMHYGNVN